MTTIEELAASRVAKLQAEKERNRADFPQTYNLLTIFKAANPRAIYAEENGRRIGRES